MNKEHKLTPLFFRIKLAFNFVHRTSLISSLVAAPGQAFLYRAHTHDYWHQHMSYTTSKEQKYSISIEGQIRSQERWAPTWDLISSAGPRFITIGFVGSYWEFLDFVTGPLALLLPHVWIAVEAEELSKIILYPTAQSTGISRLFMWLWVALFLDHILLDNFSIALIEQQLHWLNFVTITPSCLLPVPYQLFPSAGLLL